uniref:ATP synthase F(0) complex subunit e, mitochondrial n=1 Tax=Mus spicilegus TaxID=10103 RepID=A0A8C6H2R3_MUSSI
PVPSIRTDPLVSIAAYVAEYGLVLGMAYSTKHYSYLKPWAEEERRIAAEEKKRLDELKRIERELAEDSVFKGV